MSDTEINPKNFFWKAIKFYIVIDRRLDVSVAGGEKIAQARGRSVEFLISLTGSEDYAK